MAMIFVTCSQCRSRFQADEKHAGKSVACPKCKNPLRIPLPEDGITIHGGEMFDRGPKDSAGKVILKPIERTETRWSWKVAIPIFAAIVVFLGLTWFLRDVFASTPALSYLGILLIAPLFVYGTYQILRDSDLEPYRGGALWTRVLIVAVVYIALWPCLDYVLKLFGGPVDIYWWFLIAPPFIFVGALASNLALELEFSDAVIHYVGFLFLTIFWRWMAGLPHLWNGGLFLPPGT